MRLLNKQGLFGRKIVSDPKLDEITIEGKAVGLCRKL